MTFSLSDFLAYFSNGFSQIGNKQKVTNCFKNKFFPWNSNFQMLWVEFLCCWPADGSVSMEKSVDGTCLWSFEDINCVISRWLWEVSMWCKIEIGATRNCQCDTTTKIFKRNNGGTKNRNWNWCFSQAVEEDKRRVVGGPNWRFSTEKLIGSRVVMPWDSLIDIDWEKISQIPGEGRHFTQTPQVSKSQILGLWEWFLYS